MIAKDPQSLCPITVSFDRTKVDDIRRASRLSASEDDSESDEVIVKEAIMAFVDRMNAGDLRLKYKNEWFQSSPEENAVRLTVNTTYEEAARMDKCALKLSKGRISISLAGVHEMWLQAQKQLQSFD